jgi:hypothetical protein
MISIEGVNAIAAHAPGHGRDVVEMGIVGHGGHRGFEIAGEFGVHVALEQCDHSLFGWRGNHLRLPKMPNTGEQGFPVFDQRSPPACGAWLRVSLRTFDFQNAPIRIAPTNRKTAQTTTTLSFKAMSTRGAPWPFTMKQVYQKSADRPGVILAAMQ